MFTGFVVAHIIKIQWGLLKPEKQNEKHKFDAIPKFQKMMIFEIFLQKIKNKENNKKK